MSVGQVYGLWIWCYILACFVMLNSFLCYAMRMLFITVINYHIVVYYMPFPPLSELQLKPKHQPYKLCRQWQDLLYRFTEASEEDISQGETACVSVCRDELVCFCNLFYLFLYFWQINIFVSHLFRFFSSPLLNSYCFVNLTSCYH